MGGFKNVGKKEYFQRYGCWYGIKRAVFLMNPLHLVLDYENKKILYYKHVDKYLKRKYLKYAEVNPEDLSFGNVKVENPIWVYWKQGIEKAPLLVQKCVSSIEEFASQEVILLSDENINRYIRIPKDIEKLNKNGNISNAALSDMIRFSLLEHFGGTWIDSTVLLSGNLPKYITNSDFFLYRDSLGLIKNPALLSTWLLHCKKNHPVMRYVRNIVFAYWKKEKHVIDYLFVYNILTIIVEKCKDSIGYFPYASGENCRQLFMEIGESYDEKMWNHIKELSSVHKLTYKLTEETYCKSDSFYNIIFKKDE